MKFGDRLKNARTEMNLTQEQVANDFFITRQTISSWENEKTYPDIASLIKLSDYYHISLDVLLKEDSGMKEYLEKKTVEKSLIPTIIILGASNFIFLFYLTTGIFNNIILFLGTLNAIALIQVLSIQLRLRSVKSISSNRIDLLCGLGLFILGISLILINHKTLGTILVGVSIANMLEYIFWRTTSKF
ncbi:helix-turn-helix domain-containing protein [Liquorilactobacillus cacaonum]|uniref:HTH cro/C1-type domain-containing protein n=1 Tax=Liquorilactobacillus cacaonum DSM 21116 TaxID=1423729 RepID=A0A0R2CN15_9LACO|nr:helix-turn-helix domain-containing protein [Liquorilactobacillus cacaonum]KRM92904.1 hypothetical protein FC80_GL000418 [Liquorilactobacillus cacaonum DSM 21116]